MATIERAVILSTGDELTAGRTLDTNAAHIAERLAGAGIDVVAVVVVGDDRARLAWAWSAALSQADVVVSTGGLGPTVDDLTTETVAAVFGLPLHTDEAAAQRIRAFFAARGRTMPANNLRQARLPAGAVVIPNGLGTAPGYRLEVDTEWGRRHAVVLPGVPREMHQMLDDEVVPWLHTARGGMDVYLSRVFQTFGLSESALDEVVAGAVDPALARLSFRAAFPQISVRVTVHGEPAEAGARLRDAAACMRERLGEFCYAEGDTTMEAEVGRLLVASGATLAVAESCTGGLIGHRLTNVPGCSAYLLADVVAYDNAVKESVLGVRRATLTAHGAVSVETAAEMAEGVRRLAGSTLGLATTGIAGPAGGSTEKPVGTICIGLAAAARTHTHRYQLPGTREWIKTLSAQIALDWVRRAQLGLDPHASHILRK